MKLFKNSLIPVFIAIVLYFAFIPPFMGCKKTVTKTITDTVIKTINDTAYYDAVCPVRGKYTGTSIANGGVTTSLSYTFEDNNLVVGASDAGTSVTYGGYKNTCDSVILSVFYTTNSSFYILRGKFSNNRNTISGTFNDLTTPTDYGTFTISK